MMTTQMQLFRSVIFAATLAVAGSAFAQTPTCVAPGCNSITSDVYNNTASGSSALSAVAGASGGVNNAASGIFALNNNTTGYGNTASGSGARYDAVEQILYLKPAFKGDFRSFLSTATGYGTVGTKDERPFVQVISGRIPCWTIAHVESGVTE
jgi:hypothetical protein